MLSFPGRLGAVQLLNDESSPTNSRGAVLNAGLFWHGSHGQRLTGTKIEVNHWEVSCHEVSGVRNSRCRKKNVFELGGSIYVCFDKPCLFLDRQSDCDLRLSPACGSCSSGIKQNGWKRVCNERSGTSQQKQRSFRTLTICCTKKLKSSDKTVS